MEALTTPPGVYAVGAAVAAGVAYKLASGAPSPEKIKVQAAMGINDPYSTYSGDGPFWTTDIDGDIPIQYAESGMASEAETPAETLPAVFKRAVERHGDKIALRVERPLKPLGPKETPPPALPDNQWKTWTYKEYYDEASIVARGLATLGATARSSSCIFGFNSPEWHISAMGSIMANVKPAGLYPTDAEDLVEYKAMHSGAIVIFVGDAGKLAKVLAVANNLPKLKAIVCWDQPHEDVKACDSKVKAHVMTWDEFLDFGRKAAANAADKCAAGVKPGGCAALIYTSGTTGKPKAVMISHDNVIFECKSLHMSDEDAMDTVSIHRSLSYLPLSHVLGMAYDIMLPFYVTALPADNYWTVSFARPYDLKAGSLGDRLRSVQPTIFLGVPRVFEKIAEKMKAIGASTKGIKKKLATWAKSLSLEHSKNCQLGGSGAYPPFYNLANKVILTKVKTALGLQHCKLIGGGGAPFQVATLEYFASIGIQIMEGYGMSETTGAVSINTKHTQLWGSIGSETRGSEMKILTVDETNPNAACEECPPAKDLFHPTEAEQGEVCFRGRLVMRGYLANPDLGEEHVKQIKKKTAEAIDAQGYLHSGDKGCISDKGMLRISGRYKELIIGAGGENIAPVPIEDAIKNSHPGIANFVMIGDKRKYNVALVTLKAKGSTGQLPGGNDLDVGALEINPSVSTVSGAMDDKTWITSISDAISKVNKDGSVCPNNNFKVQKFTILPRDFSIDTDELGPTLKTKRFVIEKKYGAIIDSMYASKDMYVRYK